MSVDPVPAELYNSVCGLCWKGKVVEADGPADPSAATESSGNSSDSEGSPSELEEEGTPGVGGTATPPLSPVAAGSPSPTEEVDVGGLLTEMVVQKHPAARGAWHALNPDNRTLAEIKAGVKPPGGA